MMGIRNLPLRFDPSPPRCLAFVVALALLCPFVPADANAQAPLPIEVPPSTPAPDAPPPRPIPHGPGFSVWGPYQAHFRGGWLFDTYARGGLRARSESGRRIADISSDLLLYGLALAPFVSAGAYAVSQGGDWIAVTELQLVNLEALAIVGLSTWALKAFFGRERPYATAGELGPLCDGVLQILDVHCDRGRNTSFVSGHAALTFASAGLVCAQTAYLGDPADSSGRVVCGVAMAAASTVAMLRIIADRHYATDTLAGMAIGLTAGLAIPVLLHFINGAWLPPARMLPFASQPRDFGPTMGVALIGLAAGSLLPLLSVPFHSGRADHADQSPARRRAFSVPAAISLGPVLTTQSTGLGLSGTF